MHRPTSSAASTLSHRDLAWVERGMGALYISIPGLLGVVLLGALRLSHHPAAHW